MSGSPTYTLSPIAPSVDAYQCGSPHSLRVSCLLIAQDFRVCTRYVSAKHAETLKKDLSWEVRTDDIFPLGDNDHNYWSGYFTSRPSLKKQVKAAFHLSGTQGGGHISHAH